MAGPIFGMTNNGPAKAKKNVAGPINGPAIIPVQQNWPSQNWVSSQTLAQPKSDQAIMLKKLAQP